MFHVKKSFFKRLTRKDGKGRFKQKDEKVPLSGSTTREGMGGLTRKCLRFRVMKKK